jgi:hypothetical protein
MIGFWNFFRVCRVSLSPILPLPAKLEIRTTKERKKKIEETRKGIKPIPGFRGSPIPNLILAKHITTDKQTKNMLLVKFSHFILAY